MLDMYEATVIIIISAIGFIVWLVRLEGKISSVEEANNRTQKDVDELRIKHEALDSDLVKQLTEIKITLAKIEGFLAINKDRE